MRILIVGAGIVGHELADALSREKHDVTIVDADAEVIRRASESMDVMGVVADGGSPRALEDAGIRKAEMVIAVTNDDFLNMVICTVADRYGVKRKIARVRHREYAADDAAQIRERLAIDRIISIEEVIVDAVVKKVELHGATEIADLADGQVFLRGFVVPPAAPIEGRSLAEIRGSGASAFIVAAIRRGRNVVVPRGTDVVQAGDEIVVLMPPESLGPFLPLVGHSREKVERVVIYGVGSVGIEVARRIEAIAARVDVIEPDEERAEAAARVLSTARVHRGSPTDPEVLAEVGAHEAEFFLAVSDDDQTNFLAALLLKKHGVRHAVVMVNDPAYVPLLESIGIDATVNPRLITVSAILQEIRRGGVRAAVRLGMHGAEVLDCVASQSSRATGKPLRELRMPRGAIIGAILREGRYILPDGDAEIRPGEEVVVFALPEAVPAIERLFSKKGLL